MEAAEEDDDVDESSLEELLLLLVILDIFVDSSCNKYFTNLDRLLGLVNILLPKGFHG